MQNVTETLQEKHLILEEKDSSYVRNTLRVLVLSIKVFFFSLTFVFQPESSCRHTNIREKVEVELVGGAVEESWDGGAWGETINSGV